MGTTQVVAGLVQNVLLLKVSIQHSLGQPERLTRILGAHKLSRGSAITLDMLALSCCHGVRLYLIHCTSNPSAIRASTASYIRAVQQEPFCGAMGGLSWVFGRIPPRCNGGVPSTERKRWLVSYFGNRFILIT